MSKTFGIWCEVWGGVTGPREAWLKDNDGLRRVFATRDEAEAEAARLNDKFGRNPNRKAEFSYTARPLTHASLRFISSSTNGAHS